MIVCREIRKVKGGYVVEVRWPYGDNPSGFGEVICRDFAEVVELLRKASTEDTSPAAGEVESVLAGGEVFVEDRE